MAMMSNGYGDEYATQQRVWYPNEAAEAFCPSSSADSTDNRRRLDSGSFSNSSDSTQGKKKRRSHRPRGCRGGGSRRNRRNQRTAPQPAPAPTSRVVLDPCQENFQPKEGNYPVKSNVVIKERTYSSDSTPAIEVSLSNSSTNSWTTANTNQLPTYTPASNHTYSMNVNGNHNNGYQQIYHDQTLLPPVSVSANYQPPQGDNAFMNVLPPLPVAEQDTKPQEKFEGPNPYALTTGNHQPFIPTQTIPDDGRIEKQRQMLATGGSLFVTSPRSFLMGQYHKPSAA